MATNKFCSIKISPTIRIIHRWFQMESPSKFELTKTEVQIADETELGEVKVMPLTSNVATSTPVQPGSIPCKNGGCKSWASRAESRMESPWHFLKTIFLISVIVALILWVIVYTFLVQYQILWRIRRVAWNCWIHRERRETWMIYALPFRRERNVCCTYKAEKDATQIKNGSKFERRLKRITKKNGNFVRKWFGSSLIDIRWMFHWISHFPSVLE